MTSLPSGKHDEKLPVDHDGDHAFRLICRHCGGAPSEVNGLCVGCDRRVVALPDDGRPEPEGAKRPEARPPSTSEVCTCGHHRSYHVAHCTFGGGGFCACVAFAPDDSAPPPPKPPDPWTDCVQPERLCGADYASGRGDRATCTLLPGHLGGHGPSYAAAHGRGPAFELGQQLTAGQVRTIDRSTWQPNPRPAAPCGAEDQRTGDLCELPAGHAKLHHATIHNDAGEEIGGHGWSDPRNVREQAVAQVVAQREDCGAGCGYCEDAPPPTDVEIATALLSDGARELETAHRHLNAQRAKCRVAEARVTELEADVQRLVRERDTSAEAAEAARLEAGELATKVRMMIADAKKLVCERNKAREAEAEASRIADRYAGANSALVELLAAQEAVQRSIGDKDMARRRLCRAWDRAREEACP